MRGAGSGAGCIGVLVCLVAAFGSLACGTSDGATSAEDVVPEQVAEAPLVARLTVAVASDGDRAVVVRGGVDTDEGLRPTIRVVGETETTTIPRDQPLYTVEAAWIGDVVLVLGLPCPAWTRADEPPVLEDIEDPTVVCGASQTTAGLWDPGTSEWREVDLGPEGATAILGSGSSSALLLSAPEANGEHQRGLRILDIDRGTTTPVPALPTILSTDPASSITYCHADRGTTALAVWEDAPPLDAETMDLDGAASTAEVYPGNPQHLLALALEDDGWRAAAPEGTPVAAASSPVCTDDGFVVSAMGQAARLTIEGGGAMWSMLDDPPQGEDVTLVEAAEGGGSPLAIVTTPPPSAENPDEPRPTEVWALEEDSWISLGPASYTSGWAGARWRDRLVELVPVPASPIELAVRVVVP